MFGDDRSNTAQLCVTEGIAGAGFGEEFSVGVTAAPSLTDDDAIPIVL